jgi:hypothetical protein
MIPQVPKQGAWIFVSHSNRDIEKVREIRNELERRGHNPVLFFLKCMDATEADDRLLWQLIEREIKAREWFVLCDSPNARNSAAVLREMELVRSMEREGKVVEIVNLDGDLPMEFQKVISISKRATVFLSYAQADASVAARIRQALVKHDYRVWTVEDLQPGSDWASETRTALEEAAKHGFVLVLLSHSLLKSAHCQREISHALEMQGNIIPVTIEPIEWSELPPQIQYISYLTSFDLTTGPLNERIEELIRNLKTREME